MRDEVSDAAAVKGLLLAVSQTSTCNRSKLALHYDLKLLAAVQQHTAVWSPTELHSLLYIHNITHNFVLLGIIIITIIVIFKPA